MGYGSSIPRLCGVAWIAFTSWDIYAANGFPGSIAPASTTKNRNP
jgi:hypothetical protein